MREIDAERLAFLWEDLGIDTRQVMRVEMTPTELTVEYIDRTGEHPVFRSTREYIQTFTTTGETVERSLNKVAETHPNVTRV